MNPLLNFGYDTIDLRELAHVGPAGCPAEGLVAITVTFKSGAERTLHVEVPPSDLPPKPQPEQFRPDRYLSKEDMLADIRSAKRSYSDALLDVARSRRATIIAAWGLIATS